MRAKINVLFVVIFLVTIFFVADSKTASACSFGWNGSEENVLNGKYKLVNLRREEWHTMPINPSLTARYSKSGLYANDGTNTLIWEAKALPINWKYHRYLSQDAKYLIHRDDWFLPGGVYFFEEGKLLQKYSVDFFGSKPQTQHMCSTTWFNYDKFEEAEGKYYLEAWDKKTYVFDFRTGQLLEKIVPTTATATATTPMPVVTASKTVSTSPGFSDFVIIWSVLGVVGLLSLLVGAKLYSNKDKSKKP